MKLIDLIPGVPQAKLVLAGIMLALFAVPTVALFITRYTLAEARKDDALHVSQRDAEIQKNRLNLASIDQLTALLAQKNAESLARGKALDDAKAQDAKDRAAFDRQYAATDAQRRALEAISRVPGGNPACRVPRAVSDALQGL